MANKPLFVDYASTALISLYYYDLELRVVFLTQPGNNNQQWTNIYIKRQSWLW